MSSYEEYCNDYALHGNPMQDAMDYELAAEFDRWDGHRMDLLGLDPYDEDDTPDDLWMVHLMIEEDTELELHFAWADSVEPEPVF